MNNNTKKIFASIGFALNEFKKSFLITFVYLIVTFGIAYLFSLITLGFYLIVSSNYHATMFFFVICLFAFILSIIFFTILNRIKKICLIKIINHEIKSKDRGLLLFIDSFLDNEQKIKGKDRIKQFGIFLVTVIFVLLVLFFVLGLYNMISSLWVKVIVFVILCALLIPFSMFITRYAFFVKSLKELVLSYKIFAKHFGLLFATTIFSLIPIALVVLIYLLLPQYVVLDYIFLFVLIATIGFALYIHFFAISFIFLEENK
jgi:hypothetical protein